MVRDNCRNARTWIMEYIDKRKSGQRKSSVGGKNDILSLMLEQSDVFTDEFMIDELLGFFGAATETTHNVLQTCLTHLMKDQESLGRIRKEFSDVFAEAS